LKFSIGFSPCPNDTFIFDALVNHKIDTEGIEFEVVLEDVQTLNEWAIQGKLDFSKISYGVLPLVLEQYVVLNSGGALGKGVGPLLIAKKKDDNWKQSIGEATIAIPGENTTAHMLFSLAFSQAQHKEFMVFHQVEDAVLNGKVDAGVIIHENRFTYQQKGLQKLMDLGEFWEDYLKLPIPLGGIVAKRKLPLAIIQKVDRLIKKSLEYASENYPNLSDYVSQHAQEMNEAVMRQHIDLYVNNYSINLGNEGKNAVFKLMEVYQQIHPEIAISFEKVFAE
jgi:1,4-dihydroxy-6-naphthoate synthase